MDKFYVIEGLLYREQDNVQRLVIPKTMRKGLVIKAHDMSGHRGVEETISKIRKYYCFPQLRRYVRAHIKYCLDCLVVKKPAGRQAYFILSHPVSGHLMSYILIILDLSKQVLAVTNTYYY